MKILKKSLSIILTMLLIMSTVMCLAVSADAASGDIIYFEKPSDWGDSISIHYWDADSNNTTWPGVAMTKVSDNIYSYTCPVSFSTFVINDTEGFQTGDLKHAGDGYIWKVGTTYTTNDFGNKCWDATASPYVQGLSVSASQPSGDFMNSISVKLSVSSATEAYYTINGGAKTSFENGDIITLGEDAEIGDTITLVLTATDGSDTKTETYTYKKSSSPVAASVVYFDNSGFNWDEVYIYAYGTKENAEWPGELMQKDSDGKYYYTLGAGFVSENIIFNNGKEKPDKEQYPENSGLPLKKGQCKLLTADNKWVDYGTPDGQPAGFAYVPSGTTFKTEAINVKIGLKNAVKGTYQIDGGTVYEYTEDTTVTVGQGKISNKDITLTLTATNEDNITTSTDYTYKRVFTKTETTFSAESDGHTSPAVNGKYSTNPNMQLGKNKTITVDGDPSDWDSSMIIAQGVANDDPRVYMPSSMHEQPWDDYALYAAWDNENIYFMWEMANTTYIVSPSDNFAASNEARPWRNSIPMYLALSVNPEIHADGTAWGTDIKTGAEFTNPFVWGCVGGVAKDGGINFTTNVDTLVAFDTNNSNGGASIFKADKYDADNDNYMFNYDTAIPIGVTSFEKQDNQNGFKIAHQNGTLSDSLIGVNGDKGTRVLGDSFEADSNWVDFKDLGYKDEYGFIYETAIPLENLGIDRDYLETNGIGVMQILTYGTSGMDCLPYDPTMQDNADVEYSYDPSTSHEKEDVDNITVPLARVGALLDDTVVYEAPFEVNFGTDKAGAQGVGSRISLLAEAYNGSGSYNYEFTINGTSVAKGTSDSYAWTPTEKGNYTIGCNVTDTSTGKTTSSSKQITIGDEPVPVTIPPTETTEPTTATVTPTQAPTTTEPDETAAPTQATEPDETVAPTQATEPDETNAPTQATEPDETVAPTQAPTSTEPDETVAPTQAPTEAPTLPAEGTFHVVAGDSTLCNGVNWDPTSALNLMTLGDDGVYSITYENVPAGTYNFKVTTNGAWDVADFNLTGDAKFGGSNAVIEVAEDGSKVTITFKESDMHANAYINDVLVDVGATEPTTEAPTEAPTTEPTTEAPTDAPATVCNHSATKITTTAATYFAKGKTVVTCAACGQVLKTTTIAKKVLKTPTVTVKAAKKSIKVTYKKKIKNATGFEVRYQIKGKKKVYTKTYKSNKKVTKVIRKLKSDKKYTVKVRAYIKSGNKIAYSKWTKAKTVKVK
ncbi:MAG: starch-binding protein [Ruminococcus sp.]